MNPSWRRLENGGSTEVREGSRATSMAMVSRKSLGELGLTTADQTLSHSFTSIYFSG